MAKLEPPTDAFANPGGSLEATRRSFNKDFLLALAADFKKHGAAAIEKVRKQQPAAYMKICALLVPREMKVEHSNALKNLTDEQLDAMINYLKASLEAQVQGAEVIDSKVIDGAALPAPVADDEENVVS
jgi:2-oxoglutarate dehydrogenase complex dehydrogenase (E1) component-like enzyme